MSIEDAYSWRWHRTLRYRTCVVLFIPEIRLSLTNSSQCSKSILNLNWMTRLNRSSQIEGGQAYQRQFEHNAQIDSVFDRVTPANENKGVTNLIPERNELICKRQKLIRIADASADGLESSGRVCL